MAMLKQTKYVSFEEFIEVFKGNEEWTLSLTKYGLELTVKTLPGPVAECIEFHSPDPAVSSDVDWATFSGRIGAMIDRAKK
jgi:hypothetical protein